MNDDLKESLALLVHQPAFIALMAAVDQQRESEIAQLSDKDIVGNPQNLAAVAGAVRAYDSIRDLWAQVRTEATAP